MTLEQAIAHAKAKFDEALKRQLDESNKQIETHAKRERELESELEEYNDERNFI